ncbi:MAG: type II toxin-antitoxin system Phd/YefM family antitoxin [Candidatus Binataceae bacterium]
MKVGLREANHRFSAIIKAVRGGKEVILTERGKPLARIVPLRPAEDREEAAIRRMVAAGILRPALKPGPMSWKGWRPIKIRGPSIVQTLREDRDARW